MLTSLILRVAVTAAQMREHTTCRFGRGEIDLWLAIDGHVYDVTQWSTHVCTAPP